jgi:hypothetical protein
VAQWHSSKVQPQQAAAVLVVPVLVQQRAQVPARVPVQASVWVLAVWVPQVLQQALLPLPLSLVLLSAMMMRLRPPPPIDLQYALGSPLEGREAEPKSRRVLLERARFACGFIYLLHGC